LIGSKIELLKIINFLSSIKEAIVLTMIYNPYRYTANVFFILCLMFFVGCGDDEYNLHLSIDGKGVISLNGNKYEQSTTVEYEYNDVVTVSYDATSYDDWEFVSFSGDLTGTSNSQRLTIDEEKYITATFQLEDSVLIDGYVNDLSGLALENVIVLSGTSTDNQISTTTSSAGYYQLKNVPVPSDKKVYVNYALSGFEEKQIYFYKEKAETSLELIKLPHLYTLTIKNDFYDKGSTSPKPATLNFIENESNEVTIITAQCSNFLKFDKWSGDVPSTENVFSVSVTITMTTNRTITAEFSQLTAHSLHVHWNPQKGSVSQNPSGITHLSGENITLSCTPKTDYNFESWIDHEGTTYSENPLTITLDDSAEYTCTFDESSNILALSISGQGTVIKSPDLSMYPSNAQVQLTAIPGHGYMFREWKGDIDSTDERTSIIMDSGKSVEAVFEKPYASFKGQVIDASGSGISGVKISSGNRETESFPNGFFLLEKAELASDVSHTTVLFEKEGFCLLKQIVSVKDQELINLNPILSTHCTISVSVSGEGYLLFTQNNLPIHENPSTSKPYTLSVQSWISTTVTPVPKTKDILFEKWSGGHTGTVHPYQFLLKQNLSISASFIEAPYAGLIELSAVINSLQILACQPSNVFSVDINGNNQMDLSEIILMMQYLSEDY
jgi:hypothetical protein